MIPIPKSKPIRLKGQRKTKFRRKIAKRANMKCETCTRYTPLEWTGVFKSGHVSHIKSYGAGGGDTMDNVKWECPHCHLERKHGLQWSKGKV